MATRTAPDEDTGDLRVAATPLKFIQFEITNYIARLTLNHAPHNVLTVPMMKEMAEAIESLNGRADIKAILLQSAQSAFSAGISLDDSRPDRVFQTLDAFTRVFQAMVDISKPVIVVVNGPAIGAGSELVGFADVVLATPKAKFAQPEVKLGVFPPFAAVMLPQLIGTKKTYELILTGEALSAEEALNFGFVNKVVPEADLQKHVDALIARIGEFSGPVLEVTKRVISSSIGRPLKEAMKTSQDLYLNELMNLEDVQEGLRAVIEKRKPVWKNKLSVSPSRSFVADAMLDGVVDLFRYHHAAKQINLAGIRPLLNDPLCNLSIQPKGLHDFLLTGLINIDRRSIE